MSDGPELDQISDIRSMKLQLPSNSQDDQFDSNQCNDLATMQNQRVRNPLSVVQRISRLMAIRNNVSFFFKI